MLEIDVATDRSTLEIDDVATERSTLEIHDVATERPTERSTLEIHDVATERSMERSTLESVLELGLLPVSAHWPDFYHKPKTHY